MLAAVGTPRDFAALHEWGAEGIADLVERALRLKRMPPRRRPLEGKSIGLCFMNPSLRTQTSFEAAAAALGGHPITLALGSGTWRMEWRDGAVMDGEAAEHLKEAVPVLGRYCATIGLRAFPGGVSWEEDRKDPWLAAFRRHSSVPVINLESALGHPCQALADQMTIRERMDPRGKNFLLTWAPHVKALPMAVPNSAAEMAAMAGMNVTIARPEGYDLDPEVMSRLAEHCRRTKARLTVTSSPKEAYRGQHVVYAKAWGSIARYGKPPDADADLRSAWIVDEAKMRQSEDAVFMHCLPVRRNLVVADEVLDGPRSVVLDQAENRLHTAKAVLTRLIPEE